MTSRVTVYEPFNRFVDEQISGPFAAMRHEHVFVPHGNRTRMVDRIQFAAPLGLLGRAAERLFLRRYLAGLIHQRALFLKAEAERRAQDARRTPPDP